MDVLVTVINEAFVSQIAKGHPPFFSQRVLFADRHGEGALGHQVDKYPLLINRRHRPQNGDVNLTILEPF